MNAPSPVVADVRSVAEIATPNASKYLQQLCKHFRHKRPVAFDERSGHIAFAAGGCDLEATEGMLKLSLATPDVAQMEQLQDVVARHLLRFAFREELQAEWRAA
jgi:hypothetical protein